MRLKSINSALLAACEAMRKYFFSEASKGFMVPTQLSNAIEDALELARTPAR